MRVALAQISSSTSPEKNLLLVEKYASMAAEQGSSLVVFPEAMMCHFAAGNLYEVATGYSTWWEENIREIARRLNIVIIAGTFTPVPGHRSITNTLLAVGIDAAGQFIEQRYDKVHLYDAFGFTESRTVTAGDTLEINAVHQPAFGLATCYDLRFPHQFVSLAQAGAQLIILSACWADGPGKTRQWNTLVQARALDSTSFILACGQPVADDLELVAAQKKHTPTGVGHSQIVSPTGEVIAQAAEHAELLVTDIDIEQLAHTRKQLAVLDNSRPNVETNIHTSNTC